LKFESVNYQKLGFELSEEFGEDRFDEPEVKNTYGVHGEFVLVGQSERTNENCGTFFGRRGCLNIEGHGVRQLDGTSRAGKVYVERIYNSCDKPSCKVCMKYGWATRQAGKMEVRLNEASKALGLPVEHIVSSVPVRDYDLSLEKLRARSVKVLKRRGIVGGGQILHAFRYNKRQCWYFSPHWHVLGFVGGGYRCRGCVKDCVGCDGFEVRTRECFKTDGYIVKVLPSRKTVFGTCWYQLNHASIKRNTARFHVVTYFGACSYRLLHVTVKRKKKMCPLCQRDLVPLRYAGSKKRILADWSSVFNHDVERSSWEDYREDGEIVWFAKVGCDYG